MFGQKIQNPCRKSRRVRKKWGRTFPHLVKRVRAHLGSLSPVRSRSLRSKRIFLRSIDLSSWHLWRAQTWATSPTKIGSSSWLTRSNRKFHIFQIKHTYVHCGESLLCKLCTRIYNLLAHWHLLYLANVAIAKDWLASRSRSTPAPSIFLLSRYSPYFAF